MRIIIIIKKQPSVLQNILIRILLLQPLHKPRHPRSCRFKPCPARVVISCKQIGRTCIDRIKKQSVAAKPSAIILRKDLPDSSHLIRAVLLHLIQFIIPRRVPYISISTIKRGIKIRHAVIIIII